MRCCKTCENAIFVKRLGEYKCKKRQITVKAEIGKRCRDWVKGTPEKSKRDEEEE